jgi:hypothetical protein
MTAVRVRYFTDPACPPDPERTRLRWLYGDQIAWELRMLVLRPHRGEGWPHERGSDATIHACRAVVAAGMRWPDRQEVLLRHLQVLAAAGELLDDSDTLELAAGRAGLPVAEIAAYCAEPEVETALQAGREAGRGCGEIDGVPHGLAPRDDAASAEEVLRWAEMPLSAGEIAAVCGRDVELERAARLDAGFWLLA